jgi:hypothetical protein
MRFIFNDRAPFQGGFQNSDEGNGPDFATARLCRDALSLFLFESVSKGHGVCSVSAKIPRPSVKELLQH